LSLRSLATRPDQDAGHACDVLDRQRRNKNGCLCALTRDDRGWSGKAAARAVFLCSLDGSG
jgi:hypothetical protein